MFDLPELIDGYMIWYVVSEDASYKEYLNISFLPLKSMPPGRPRTPHDPTVLSGVIQSYTRYAFPRDPVKRRTTYDLLYPLLSEQKTLLSIYSRLQELAG